MNTYFNIRYEFDKAKIHEAIATQVASGRADYICVADGVILNTVNRNEAYKKVVNDGMFSICDSSYVPLYLRLIYGKRYKQYCGSDIFQDIISEKKYRMAFLGTNQCTLNALRRNLIKMNPAVEQMTFYELPYCKVEEFDYASNNVLITSWIEANKKSLAFWAILIFKPVGSDSCAFASTSSKLEIVSVALVPAI